ncbi:MAG: glycoside hydrolase family 3 N-terminal domain-containing protein, partial [Balneolaceae bacterium]|nr:glycoside hydrolase family 3 N-terminal domain-containing protein [Balneolaceae bacterium]
PGIVKRFGTIASKEYRGLGITTALSPQIDLATDPRWSRVDGTFGGDPDLSAAMARAYVDGFQTSEGSAEIEGGWGYESVNAMIKHWPGGGAEEGGRDGHYDYGKYTVYPGENFERHLVPFQAAFNLDGPTGSASAVMPYYTISYNQDPYGLNVGNAYSNYMINSLLRGAHGYDGVVCTDWGITDDRGPRGGWGGGRPWGLEDIEVGDDVADLIPGEQEDKDAAGRLVERFYRLVMSGVDQFGGENEAWPILAAYRLGVKRVGERLMRARFERSAVRLLKNIFRVGLFEDPYLDPERSEEILGDPEYMKAGYEAQLKSIVMLKNGTGAGNRVLPLDRSTKVYIPDAFETNAGGFFPVDEVEESWYDPVDDAQVSRLFERVDTPGEADAAIVFVDGPIAGRGEDPEDPLNSYRPISLQYRPYTAEGTHTVTGRSYEGRTVTTHNEKELDLILDTVESMGDKPVIVLMRLENPAVVNEFEAEVEGLVVHFGISNQALLDIVSGSAEPSGLLPFQMPEDMLTVEQQFEDVGRDMEPHVDEAGNEYDFAFGLNWNGPIRDGRYQQYFREEQLTGK